MIRQLVTAVAIAASAIGAAPSAVADDPSGRYDGDVPNMNYDASLNAPCYSWERFIFGRSNGGQAMQCHWIPNQWPPIYNGFWVISYPLYGVHNIGEPCENPRGASAQSPDGIALVCTAQYGWQQWV
jgi:hypothetical protein